MNRKQRRLAQSQDHKPEAGIHFRGGSYTLEEACALAIKEQNLGNIQAAAELYPLIIAKVPGFAAAHNNYGVIRYELKRYDEALASYDQAIALNPAYADAWYNRGNVLQKLKRYEEALAGYDQALALKPGHADGWYNRGNALQKLKRYEDALASYDKAIALKPDLVRAYHNRGAVLHDMKRYEEALASFDKAAQLKADYAEAYSNQGFTLQAMRRYDEALERFDRATALKPDLAEAYSNRGITLHQMRRYDEMLASFDKAIALKPDYGKAYHNRGVALHEMKRYGDAAASFEKAMAIDPEIYYVIGALLHAQTYLCQWQGLESLLEKLTAGIEAGKPVSPPFAVLAASHSLRQQRICAEIYVQNMFPPRPTLWNGERYAHAKIRIAYVSADFREHPLAYLLAGVFEKHDKTRFELYGISLKSEDAGITGQRIKAAFDRFIDVSKKSDREVAQLLRELEIDIAVDLMGFTGGCRTAIFAHRPVPVQVNYLGYPATMGADYIDYIIADAFVIPPQSRKEYSEKIITMPDCFQANDDKRPLSKEKPPRAKYGLPENAFVFCSFNTSYKITPQFFDIWMRLLKAVAGSVLWLVGDDKVQRNLCVEASKRGVDPSRLVFAPMVKYEDHLARLQNADLVLDTLPFNAGTTASDALWAGVPLVTCTGEAFAARMAGSLLTQVGLPELITGTLADYEALALELAADAKRLAAIKAKLAQRRATGPLFDTARFTKNLEDAYNKIWERTQAGLPAEHIGMDAALSANDIAPLLTKAFGLHQAAKLDDAAAIYKTILASDPHHADALRLLGTVYYQQDNHLEALRLIEFSLQISPRQPDGWNNRGNALQSLKRYDEALASYDKATLLKPDYAEAYRNRGNCLLKLGRMDAALANYDKAIALKPDMPDIHVNRGHCLRHMRRLSEALASYDKAIALKAGHAEAWYNRGITLQDMDRYGEALPSFEKAMALKSDIPYLLGSFIHCKMHLVDWRGLEAMFETLASQVEAGVPASMPLVVVATPLSPALQKECAEMAIVDRFPPSATPLWSGEVYGHEKIRVGYFSADFHAHPMAYLMAGLFEVHDRSRFEIIGFSLDAHPVDDMRKRLEKGFDRFIDVRNKTDGDVAALARSMEIDIAVDLNGFTRDARAGIFALRPAPVQVSYMGYPGTMGASYIDYIVADAMLIPEEDKGCYSEKIVTLPHSYQVNDSSRQISDTKFARAEMGLPEEGFVFCCFNNSYKITPEVFDIWMRLLKKVERSVLWLSGVKSGAAENLYAEAEKRGIEKHRLVFAGRMPDIADHLARYRLADVFLDTFHYNAHATASDALWAGLPVVTCVGKTFAARVAASLLNAVGLPELITHSHKEYEALALELAGDPKRLAAIKEKLAQNRSVYPLFDTALFAGHIEDAYVAMWEKTQAGLPAEHIYVRARGDA